MENYRYKFWRLGQDAEKANELDEAIGHYKIYSTHLEDKDKHIPMLWIHNILINQKKYLEAKKYFLQYCERCSFPYAAKILKDKASFYKNQGFKDIYDLFIKESKRYQEKQLELKKAEN